MTSPTQETPMTTQEIFSHPSGALNMPGTPRLPEPRIWFPDCSSCHTGNVLFYAPNWGGPSGERHQCPCCENRYFQWHKEQRLVRYVVLRSNYPHLLRIEKTRSKSAGRLFYHEVDYSARKCEGVHVQASALNNERYQQEQLRIEGAYSKSFPTIAEASVWICQQIGGSLRAFWLS